MNKVIKKKKQRVKEEGEKQLEAENTEQINKNSIEVK